MAYMTGFRWLTTANLNRIIGTLAAQLEIQRPLIYLARLPIVPAFDDELIGRFTGKIFAADLIADDQQAVIQEGMTLEVSSNTAPNVKIGQRLGQRLLNRIRQLERGEMTVAGQNALADWDQSLAANLLLGVRWRMNVMACAMMIDAFSYNRWGIKLTNATWGMPANLKVTVGTAWSNVASTPLSDIWGMDQVASLAYGVTYDTVTMTTPDFRNMIATTEFANKATLTLGAYFLTTPAALPTKQDPRMMQIAGQVLNKTIVLDDFQFNVRNNDGTTTTSRALPTGTVLLSRAQDNGNAQTWDMANSVPTEAIAADMIGNAPDGIGGEQYGPIAYFTGREDLNPPDVSAWAVARCFPRKHIPEATAVLSGV